MYVLKQNDTNLRFARRQLIYNVHRKLLIIKQTIAAVTLPTAVRIVAPPSTFHCMKALHGLL